MTTADAITQYKSSNSIVEQQRRDVIELLLKVGFPVIAVMLSFRNTSPVGIYIISALIPWCYVILMLFLVRAYNVIELLTALSISSIICLSSLLVSTNIFWSGFLHHEMYLFVAINAFMMTLMFSLIGNRITDEIWIRATTLLIAFNGIFFLLQTGVWYLFGKDLDLGPMLGGTPHRAMFYSIYRPTGIYAEPSIYAGYMLVFIAIRYALKRKVDGWMLFGLVTMPITLSTLGILLTIVAAALLFFKRTKKHMFGALLLMAGVLTLTWEKLYDRAMLFLAGEDGSNNLKINIVKDWLENSELFTKGFGIIKKVELSGQLDSLGDITFYLNMPMFFGIYVGAVIVLIVVALIFTMQTSVRAKLLLYLSLVKFSSLAHPFFWLFIAFIIYKNREPKIASVQKHT